MTLPKWFPNRVRAGEAPELVTSRNFDRLNGALSQYVKRIGENSSDIITLESRVNRTANYLNIMRSYVYNIVDYGAKGGGVDDYLAIMRTLNAAAAAGGGIVFVPGRTFNYGTKITLDAAYNGVSIHGVGEFVSVLRYTGTDDGFSLGGNLNGLNLFDFRLYSTTGRDAISITAGTASATPDGGVLYWARVDIRGWLRHAIKARLTVDVRTERLGIVQNGGCGLYIENANPYRSTTWTDTGSWLHENGGHGIVLKGTFTHTLSGTISDSNTGLSMDADTISSAGYTVFLNGGFTPFAAADIGKNVVFNGSTVGTLAHYSLNGDAVINATAPVPVVLAGGFTAFLPSDIGKSVLVNAVNVGPLVSYTVGGEFVVQSIAKIQAGQSVSVVGGTGSGTTTNPTFSISTGSGAGTIGAQRKNNHGLYAARSAYLNVNGGHFENHIYGIFLDSVYDSYIAAGYYLTQGAGAWGFYAAGTCTRVVVPVLGVDVQAGGAGAAYKGPLTIGVNWYKPGAYTTRDESPNSISTDAQNAGSTLFSIASTGSDPFSSSTTQKRIGMFSGTDDVESIFSVNNSGGASGRPTYAWRKDDTILARAFTDNNLNSFVFKIGSNVFVITNGTLEDVIQTNNANNFYIPMRGSLGFPIIEWSSGAVEGVHSIGRISGVAQANNGEIRAAEIDLLTFGVTANERGGQIILSTRTRGAAGALVARLTLDDSGLTPTSQAGTGNRLVQASSAGLQSASITIPSGGGVNTYAARGSVTMVAGVGAVADTAVTSAALIRYWVKTAGGTQGALSYANTAGVGFSINSSNILDTSTVQWEIVSY